MAPTNFLSPTFPSQKRLQQLSEQNKKQTQKEKKTATTENKTKKKQKNKKKTLGIWWAIKRKRRNTVLFVIDASTYNSSGYASHSWSTAGS